MYVKICIPCLLGWLVSLCWDLALILIIKQNYMNECAGLCKNYSAFDLLTGYTLKATSHGKFLSPNMYASNTVWRTLVNVLVLSPSFPDVVRSFSQANYGCKWETRMERERRGVSSITFVTTWGWELNFPSFLLCKYLLFFICTINCYSFWPTNTTLMSYYAWILI